MRRRMAISISMVLLAASASAQFGGLGKLKDKMDDAQNKAAPYTNKMKAFSDVNKQWTPEQEEQIGESTAAKLIQAFGIYDNKPMQNYLQLVGSTVAAQGARQDVTYHFAILDTESMNAMALPGGFVFVTRGALANMTNEAQLAGVLAHEVAHVDGRHLEHEVKTQGNMGLIAKAAQEEGAKHATQDQMTQTIISKLGDALANFVVTKPYSSGDESSADKKGLDLAAKAGYNSAGLRDFLQKLAAASEDPANAQALSAWSQTHPPYNVRVDNLTKLMASYPANGQTVDSRFQTNINAKAFGQ
jgi:beta-barrel assembly-enhancing protease